jgi:hypothetical protein
MPQGFFLASLCELNAGGPAGPNSDLVGREGHSYPREWHQRLVLISRTAGWAAG